MGTIRFEIRKEKIDKDGLIPIRMIYQVQGKRKYCSTGKKLFEDNWNENEQVATHVKKLDFPARDIKEINDTLDELRRKIERIEKLFELKGIPYSAEMVMDELNDREAPKTKKDSSSKELHAFIDRYIQDNTHSRVSGSLSVYKALKQHLQAYEKDKKVTISFERIDLVFFKAFQNYLFGLKKKDRNKQIVTDDNGQPVKALNDITIAKQLSTLKTFLNYAKASNISIPGNYGSFKIERDNDLEVVSLTQSEYKLLYNLDLSSRPAWDQVRDVFCFSCNTGLRYSDLKQLKREHIKGDYIRLKAIKTGHKTAVPLNPDAKAILKKYEKERLPLPVISNQKSNEHLAEICEHAGINSKVEIVRKYGNQRVAKTYPKYELIRMHCGRKSFATISIERGMRAEVVMKIGGWKDWKSFKRYVDVSDESAMDAMKLAYSAPAKKSNLRTA